MKMNQRTVSRNILGLIVHSGVGCALLFCLFSGQPLAGQELVQPDQVIMEPSPASFNEFGGNVAVSGTVMAVAANGFGRNWTGPVYVYEREEGSKTWELSATLTAPVSSDFDSFGSTLEIFGDTLFVGAFYADDGCTNGGDCDSGSVFVFEKRNGAWEYAQTLHSNPVRIDALFGTSIEMAGETLFIGSTFHSLKGKDAGAVFAFEKIDGSWVQTKAIVGDDTSGSGFGGDWFGSSMSADGDTLAVSASEKQATYIFERNAGGPDNWGQVRKFVSPNDLETMQTYFRSDMEGDILVMQSIDYSGGNDVEPIRTLYIHYRNEGGENNWGEVYSFQPPGDPYTFRLSGETLYVGLPFVGPQNASYGFAAYERNMGGADAWGLARQYLPEGLAESDVFGIVFDVHGGVFVASEPGKDEGRGSVYSFISDTSSGPSMWAGYPIANDAMDVNTEGFLGWINVFNGDYIWSYSLGGWIYCPEANVSDSGAWVYVPQ